MKKFPILFLIIFLGGLFLPLVSLAAGIYQADGIDICYEGLIPCGTGKPYWENGTIVDGKCQGTKVDEGISCQLCHLFVLLKSIIDFVLVYVIFPIATLLLIVGGLMFFLYAENPQKIDEAKSLLTSVVIGLVLIFSAWLVIGLFFTAIGLSDFALSFTGPGNWFQIGCDITLPSP